MAVEPDVVPPALESGHVSVEEIRGDEPNETGFGAEYRQLQQGIGENDLRVLNAAMSSTLGSQGPSLASSVVGHSLPTHLKATDQSDSVSMTGFSRASSTSRALSTSRAPSVVSTVSRQLPPHLQGQSTRAESVITATTMREARATTIYNRWDSQGNQHVGLKVPTTISSITSETGRTESTAVPASSVAGDTNVSSAEFPYSIDKSTSANACKVSQDRADPVRAKGFYSTRFDREGKDPD